ncbi:MAG: 50S ribosomal protein L25/general stress protein Ctc [Coxiellaceae bacterium]|nr:MAG: 50S ribosomal protein L25/general stress protein Ctc [Coxiellaceae bacterium]
MTATFELTADIRNQVGKRANRRIRTADKVPGTVYGGDKEATNIVMDHLKLSKALANEAFYSSILTLSINGQPEKVVIKAIQRHPFKPRVMHLDFFRINMNEKLNMHIPLHFVGENKAPGLVQGGVISHYLNEVEIRCLPADLPEFIEVDLSQLNLGDYVHLSDIKLPSSIEIVALAHGDDKPVASLHMPHVMEEPETTAPVSAEVPAIEVSAEAPEETAGKE